MKREILRCDGAETLSWNYEWKNCCHFLAMCFVTGRLALDKP